MYHSTLRIGAQRQLKNIGKADLVIGLPTYKNAQSAAYTARVALEGAEQYYPHLRTVLINADTGLKATTRRAVMDQAFDNGHNSMVVTGRYDGLPGQGSATAALLDAALALDAKAIVILDSHTQSINPNWIAGLAHLIFENKADLVLPRYHHWLSPDGALCDLIAYPLFRALWGQSVRCPTAPDFALSPQLAAALLDEDIWGTAAAKFGLPPWLATYGIVNKWRVVQSAVGQKNCEAGQLVSFSKQKDDRQAEQQFKAHFQDLLNVIFNLAYKYRNFWKTMIPVHSSPTLTQFASEVNPKPTSHIDDTTWLLDELALGWIEYRVLWQQILTPDNMAYIEALASLPPDRFYFPPDLWAQIVYDFVLVFNKGEVDPVQVVDALFPLYQGRLAAFLQEIAGLASVGREGTVAAQAVEFEETRAYLKKRWVSYQPR
jgi:hypothetical protein